VKALLPLLISAATALGGALPGRALYDCAMTGKRDQPACCCRSAAGSCPSCARCEPEASRASPLLHRAGPGPQIALIGAACCSVTHERNTIGHARPAGAESAWKVGLQGARLAAALAPWTEPTPLDSAGSSPRGPPPLVLPGAGRVPLFIVHCSLTL